MSPFDNYFYPKLPASMSFQNNKDCLSSLEDHSALTEYLSLDTLKEALKCPRYANRAMLLVLVSCSLKWSPFPPVCMDTSPMRTIVIFFCHSILSWTKSPHVTKRIYLRLGHFENMSAWENPTHRTKSPRPTQWEGVSRESQCLRKPSSPDPWTIASDCVSHILGGKDGLREVQSEDFPVSTTICTSSLELNRIWVTEKGAFSS